MNDAQIFAYVILPLGIAVVGALVGLLYGRGHREGTERHPGE